MNVMMALIILIILIILFWYFSGFDDIKTPSKNVNALIRQVYRWHIASIQDKNPIIAMLHSNYAAGYIGALRSISTEGEIFRLTGLDINQLEKEVIYQQDKTLSEFSKACPSLMPKGSPAYDHYLQQFLSEL